VLDNARELLAAAGLDLTHVVSGRVFLPNLADFGEMNRVYREYFPDAPPARATVGAALTQPAYNVEMTFVASAAPRVIVEAGGPRYPNVSPAVLAGPSLYLAGAVADPSRCADPRTETRDIIRRVDALLTAAGFDREAVRDLSIYATTGDAANAATEVCRETFGHGPCITAMRAALAVPDASVEIMTYARRADA
jgi:enamine deaminase RidA (YjgF/YER057c/UK114 family)